MNKCKWWRENTERGSVAFLKERERERVRINSCAVLDKGKVNGWGQLGGAVVVVFVIVVVNCFLFVWYARGKISACRNVH